jgi:uncharacterized protein YabN with tetrapyrrole methylase and pyrophosphatase domain
MRRFRFVEKKIKQENKELGQVDLKELERIWEEAKKQE